jgi:hypothetical protein
VRALLDIARGVLRMGSQREAARVSSWKGHFPLRVIGSHGACLLAVDDVSCYSGKGSSQMLRNCTGQPFS